MSWTGGSPGGSSGGNAGGGGSGGGGSGGPWGPSGGGRRPGGNPWGGPRPPGRGFDADRLAGRLQAFLRTLLPGGAGRGGRAAILLAVVLAALWLASGFYVVRPDELGVVLRFGAFARTAPPGLNYHLPWPIEEVLLPPVTRINRLDIGFRTTGGPGGGPTQVPLEARILTGDENIVDVNVTVFWRIRNAEHYLFNIRHSGAVVKSVTESVTREVIGLMPIEPVLTSARTQIEQSVQAGVQKRLDGYRSGVEIVSVQLQRVDPPAQVLKAFRDVQAAREDARRAVNVAEGYRNSIVPRARGQAAKIIAAAEAQKAATIAHAQGQAKRFDSVLAAYRAAKRVTLERIYIETMQQLLSQSGTLVVGPGLGQVLPLLPLTHAAAPPAAIPAAPAAPPTSGGGAQP